MSDDLKRLQDADDEEARAEQSLRQEIEQAFVNSASALSYTKVFTRAECETLSTFLESMRSVSKAQKKWLLSGEHMQKQGWFSYRYINRVPRKFWQGAGWEIGTVRQPILGYRGQIRFIRPSLDQTLYLCDDGRLRYREGLPSNARGSKKRWYGDVAAVRTADRSHYSIVSEKSSESLATVLSAHLRSAGARVK